MIANAGGIRYTYFSAFEIQRLVVGLVSNMR